MKEAAELLTAIALLLWPVFAFIVLWLYHSELRSILGRFRRGKLFGQELELEAIVADVRTRPLASAAASDSVEALLESTAFRARIREIVGKDQPEGAISGVIDAARSTASQGLKQAFVRVDTTPLLGSHGKVWEEPYTPGLTVRQFLDRIWFEMRPHVKPYRYPDGWLIRDPKGRSFPGIGRNWARRQGLKEDERSLADIGIQAGSGLEVVAGPKSKEALNQGVPSLLNIV